MIVLRPRLVHLGLVLEFFKSHPRQSLGCDLKKLNTCLRFPYLGRSHIIDSVNLTLSLSLVLLVLITLKLLVLMYS